MRCSLLSQIHSVPSDVLEELKVRLQLKDHLFQEVLADRTRQARQHQEQVKDLLRTISARDQYIQVVRRTSVKTLFNSHRKKNDDLPPPGLCELAQ